MDKIDKIHKTYNSEQMHSNITYDVVLILNSSATSNGVMNSLSNYNGGHCVTSNMKMVIYVCNGTTGEKIEENMFDSWGEGRRLQCLNVQQLNEKDMVW